MEKENQMKIELDNMFNTPDYEHLGYLFNTIMKYIYKPDADDKPYAIISAMQIKNFIVTNNKQENKQ
jgi:hypothetical protein